MALYTGLALFAGGGGLELGLKLALGDRYKCVAFVERSIEAAAVLATQMERGGLDKGVIWDDVTTFTGDVVSPFVDNIDIISEGFPCQPWSVAGNRKGTDDDRWLWPHIFRLVREIRPRNIFLENVTGLLHGGIEHVLGDLASVGFDAQWISLRASSVSAPHRRERVFILGNSRGTRSQIGEVLAGPVTGQGSAPVANTGSVLGQDPQPGRTQGRESSDASGASRELGNTNDSGDSASRYGVDGNGAQGEQRRNDQPQREPRGFSEAMGNSDSQGLQGRQQPVGQSSHERPAWPPSPADTDAWEQVDEQYFPATQPEVRGVANGLAGGLGRADKLRILGNGVVPQQAALAYTVLSERISNP